MLVLHILLLNLNLNRTRVLLGFYEIVNRYFGYKYLGAYSCGTYKEPSNYTIVMIVNW